MEFPQFIIRNSLIWLANGKYPFVATQILLLRRKNYSKSNRVIQKEGFYVYEYNQNSVQHELYGIADALI